MHFFGPGLLDLGAGITKYHRMDSHIKTFYCATARFNVQYALCNVHYAMCNVQCAMCNVHVQDVIVHHVNVVNLFVILCLFLLPLRI